MYVILILKKHLMLKKLTIKIDNKEVILIFYNSYIINENKLTLSTIILKI